MSEAQPTTAAQVYIAALDRVISRAHPRPPLLGEEERAAATPQERQEIDELERTLDAQGIPPHRQHPHDRARNDPRDAPPLPPAAQELPLDAMNAALDRRRETRRAQRRRERQECPE